MKISVGRIIVTLLALGVVGFIAMIVMFIFGRWIFQAFWAFVSGWATYPFKILPQVNYNVEMILCGIAALALAMYFAHRFLKWIAEHIEALPTPWSFKYTSSLSFLLLSMFGTSIAMTGIIHQAAWLVSADKITNNRSRSITTVQISEARDLVSCLFIYVTETDEDQRFFPISLTELTMEDWYDLGLDALLCSYDGRLEEPWLYPGSGKSLSDGVFPVIVSPRANSSGRIVVGYSTALVESYLIEELPPEIAVFFN